MHIKTESRSLNKRRLAIFLFIVYAITLFIQIIPVTTTLLPATYKLKRNCKNKLKAELCLDKLSITTADSTQSVHFPINKDKTNKTIIEYCSAQDAQFIRSNSNFLAKENRVSQFDPILFNYTFQYFFSDPDPPRAV